MARVAVIAAVVANLAAVIWAWSVGRLVQEKHEGLKHFDGYLVPSGYDFLGGLHVGSATRGRCVGIHYTSDYCQYCAPGSDAWRTLAAWLGNEGCAIVELTPSPATGVLHPGSPFMAEPLTTVTMDWMAGYDLFGTPSTVVISSSRKALWFRAGGVAPPDLAGVEESLARSGLLRSNPGGRE